MIELNDLSKELTEVMDSDLGLVVGGGIFDPAPSPPSVEIPFGNGFSTTLPTSGSIDPAYILQVPLLNYNIGNGSTISAAGDGTLGVTTNQGPLSVTASGNPGNGSTGIKASFGIRF